MSAAVHAVIFPKKQGAELEKSAKFVNEVYAGAYPNAKPHPRALERSSVAGKFLHVTYHTIPADGRQSLRLAALAAYVALWLLFYPLAAKLTALALASAYTLVESAFTAIERGKPYTSAGQFGANLLWIPFLLHGFAAVFGSSPALYVGLFPLNVWLLEVVEEWCILRPIFGRNVAWCYRDYADEALAGCVRLGHAPCWWALGAVVFWATPMIDRMSSDAAAALGGAVI